MIDLSCNIAGVELKNPVVTASGTFGIGREYSEFVDIDRLGAITTKGVSLTKWKGNPPPRSAEVYGGMLNAVGLQNPGVEAFIKDDIPFLKKFDTKIIVNICGHNIKEYAAVAERLSETDIDIIEVNISCPNVTKGALAFGQDKDAAAEVTREVKRKAKKPVIVKLSPNVTDITVIAKACEDAGADGLSLINTLLGMKIDIHQRKPVLANITGGLSGPCIKPVAVRMVWQTARAVNIPIIGIGGICTAEDAIEFLIAGASAVAVGTGNFIDPLATENILDGIIDYMQMYGINRINDLNGR